MDDSALLAAETEEPREIPPEPNSWLVRPLVILTVLAIVAFLYFARPIMLPVFMACYAAMTLKPVVRWLGVIKFPAPLGATVLLLCFMGLVAAGIAWIRHPAVEWINEAPQHVEQLRERARSLFTTAPRIHDAAAAVTDLVTPAPPDKAAAVKPVPVVAVKDAGDNAGWMTWTSSALESIVATVVLAYLLLAAGDRPLQKLVNTLPTLGGKRRAVEISHEVQRAISNYLFSMTLINAVFGVLIGIGLFFMGVPSPIMWGTCAALLNYIPYFGPYVGMALIAIVGVLTFPSLGHGLLPVGWYIFLHLIESNLVTPFLLGRRCRLNPVAIFASLMFWTWLWGVPGAWLSVPVLVAVKVVCEKIPSLSTIAEAVGP